MRTARAAVRVGLISTSHPVSYSRFRDREAVSLARAGYNVTLVGLGPTDSEELADGIRFVACQTRQRLAKPMRLARLRNEMLRRRFDVYHCLDPWSLLVALWLKSHTTSLRVVYEASEWFPQTYRDRTDLPLPLRYASAGIATAVERWACREADLIIETNRTRATRFQRLGRQPVLVPNYPPLDLLPEPSVERQPWIAWTGLISRARGFIKLLEALVLVRREQPAVQLHVVGGFDPRDDIETWARLFIDRNGLADNVIFHGVQPYSATLEIVGRCLIGVILLQPERGNDYTGQPNKLFEFMGAGLAVVASDFPEISPIVRRHQCGELVDPRDAGAIAAIIGSLLAAPERCHDYGRAGREAVIRNYHWSLAEQALLTAYSRVLS